MLWNRDPLSAARAIAFPLPIYAQLPANQFEGRNFNPEAWNDLTLYRNWPPEPIRASPEQIVTLFEDHFYLEAVAMVFHWGQMRQRAAVYENHPLATVNNALNRCFVSIEETHSIENAWHILTGQENGHLQWSAVMASKVLHFLCRAIFPNDRDVPVPRDGKVSLGYVWPGWISRIRPDERPHDWSGNSFEAYNRYMTAISVWADRRGWSTTEVETTLFREC